MDRMGLGPWPVFVWSENGVSSDKTWRKVRTLLRASFLPSGILQRLMETLERERV